MLTNTMPVALLTSNQQEAQLFTSALGECGFRRFTTFTSGEEAYEVCSRQQFPLFITRMELADMSGIVFLQKLRETGNYGMEPHLFVCNKLEPKLVNILADLDLDYVLVPPLQKANIVQKFKHMIQTENNLSSVEVQYRDAKAAFSNNIFDMAESFIKAALTEKPDLEKAVILLGDIEAKRNNIALANQQYKTALSINPKSATAMHKLAQILMAQGEYGQATAFLDRLAAINPYSIKVLENAGLSNLNCDKLEQAMTHMSQLSKLDSNNKTVATVTASVHIKQGDYSNLVSDLGKTLNEKELIQFLNNAGAKLSSDNDVDGAIKMYQGAIAQIQENKFLYAIHYNLGLAYKKKNEIAKAITHFEKSLKLNPEFAKAASVLAELKSQAA